MYHTRRYSFLESKIQDTILNFGFQEQFQLWIKPVHINVTSNKPVLHQAARCCTAVAFPRALAPVVNRSASARQGVDQGDPCEEILSFQSLQRSKGNHQIDSCAMEGWKNGSITPQISFSCQYNNIARSSSVNQQHRFVKDRQKNESWHVESNFV